MSLLKAATKSRTDCSAASSGSWDGATPRSSKFRPEIKSTGVANRAEPVVPGVVQAGECPFCRKMSARADGRESIPKSRTVLGHELKEQRRQAAILRGQTSLNARLDREHQQIEGDISGGRNPEHQGEVSRVQPKCPVKQDACRHRLKARRGLFKHRSLVFRFLRAAFAPDPDVVMYGTGADEKRVGLAQIQAQAERDWSQAEAAAVTYESIAVSAAGAVAWAAADAAFRLKAAGQEMTLPARITFVLEKREAQWLVVHAHFSVPAAGQAEGESYPA